MNDEQPIGLHKIDDFKIINGTMKATKITIGAVAILPDGTIERLPNFTTTDAASLEFWKTLESVAGGFFINEIANAKHLKQLDDVTAIAISPGNADVNDYLRGMANGLLLAQSIFKGGEPKYIEHCRVERLTD